MKIFVIEDDLEVSAFIVNKLQAAGHMVETTANGADGLNRALVEKFDVMIVDRMLPKMHGLDIIKALRAKNNLTPILILSTLGDVDDRVLGLRSGGDDYLVKPFAFDELLARVEILNKRNNFIQTAETKLTADDLEMDLLARKITRAGKKITLQTREFQLLEYLLKNKGQIVTRTMLLQNVWEYNFDPQTNVIDVHMSRLRNKIDKEFDKPIIKTIKGTGFIIE